LLAKLGPELAIQPETSLEEIEQAGGSLLAEGIRRMRRNEVNIAAGYDGEFGASSSLRRKSGTRWPAN
jgi:hypothetical protein